MKYELENIHKVVNSYIICLMNYNHSALDLLHFSWSLENGSTHHKTTVHKLPSVADLHIPFRGTYNC